MAGACEILEEMQWEIICAICRNYLSEPVTMECSHTFCRACVSSCWRAGPSSFSCPLCRQVSQGAELPEVNNYLAQATDLTKQLSSQLLQSTEGHSHCATHKDEFKLFCEDDQIPLCVRCSQRPEHKSHKLSPVEEAAHHCREKFQHFGSQLKKCSEEAEELVDKGKTLVLKWHSKITDEYFKLYYFLCEEEERYLDMITEEQMARKDRISQHMQTLQDLMLDVKKAGDQSNVDFLQGMKQLLRRTESTMSQSPKPVTQELRDYPISGMIEILRQFRVDLRMDPTSASPSVIFSEDRKSVKAGEGWQVDTENPDESECHFVCAEQSFSSGRQYWEVDVTQLPQWMLGIHIPSLMKMKGGTLEPSDSVFLLRCVKKKEDYYLETCPASLTYRVKSPLARVGVYLDHISGTLVFYNVLQGSLIYKFYSIIFTAPVSPTFCPGPPLPGTKAGPMILCPVNSHMCTCCYSSL